MKYLILFCFLIVSSQAQATDCQPLEAAALQATAKASEIIQSIIFTDSKPVKFDDRCQQGKDVQKMLIDARTPLHQCQIAHQRLKEQGCTIEGTLKKSQTVCAALAREAEFALPVNAATKIDFSCPKLKPDENGWVADLLTSPSLYITTGNTEGRRKEFYDFQTSQPIPVAVLALFRDIGVTEDGFMSSRRRKKSLKAFSGKISNLATECRLELERNQGQFAASSGIVRDLKALDLVNRELHRRKSAVNKNMWQEEIKMFLFLRFKVFYPNLRKGSFNFCKNDILTNTFHDAELCGNIQQVKQCLTLFQNSPHAPQKRLSETELRSLFSTDGLIYGIANIPDLMTR